MRTRPLSPRQREVLLLASHGLHNHEIASRLGIAEETVKSLMRQTLDKLGVGSRTHAVATALRTRVIE